MTVAAAGHFYKYKPPPQNLEWLKDTIVSHRLYFPLPSELNDPVEARPRLDMSLGDIERFLYRDWCEKHPSASEEARKQELREIREGIDTMGLSAALEDMTKAAHERYGKRRVFSLSKRWDNMSLWAKYAADHHGCCLEFANAGIFERAREIHYVDVVTEDVLDDSDLGGFYFRKRRDWSNEEEVRVMGRRDGPSVVTIDPALLTQVILGKDMAADLRDQILLWSQERNPQLVVRRAEYDPFGQALRLV